MTKHLLIDETVKQVKERASFLSYHLYYAQKPWSVSM